MRARDIIFLTASFGGMFAGAFLPWPAETLDLLTTPLLVSQILLCFLSGTIPGTSFTAEALRGLPRFLILKMLVLPMVCWVVFLLLLPEYATGALLLGGAAVGVMAPFFLALVRGDEAFGTAAFITSSLLVPFTVPLVMGCAALLRGTAPADGLLTPFLHFGLFLTACLLPPFIAAKLIWAFKPALGRAILQFRYSVAVISSAGIMGAVFARHSEPLRREPALVPESLAAVFLLAGLLFALGYAFGRGKNAGRRVAWVVGFCAMNNVLMTLVASRCFGVREVLLCALYSVPFNLLPIPYRMLSARLRAKSGADSGAPLAPGGGTG